MGKKLYVGGLPYSFDDTDLKNLFSTNERRVESARVIMDRESGRSKGFGFVEMASESEAQSAIKELNGSEQGGRTITVNEALPEREKTGGAGGRGGRGGAGGRGGFGGGGNRDRGGW